MILSHNIIGRDQKKKESLVNIKLFLRTVIFSNHQEDNQIRELNHLLI